MRSEIMPFEFLDLVIRMMAAFLIIYPMLACGDNAGKPESKPSMMDVRLERALAEARGMSSELASKLQSSLMNELGSGSFAGAIRVCSKIGQAIPKALADSTGHYIRRVSQRYRNPNDIPDDYEHAKLADFDRLNQQNTLEKEYYEVVRENAHDYFRYMKPLLTTGMCLNCHGPEEKIPAKVRAVLTERYPDDRAIGYHAGEIRGAISVKIALDGEIPGRLYRP
jgi:hypothetical protein